MILNRLPKQGKSVKTAHTQQTKTPKIVNNKTKNKERQKLLKVTTIRQLFDKYSPTAILLFLFLSSCTGIMNY